MRKTTKSRILITSHHVSMVLLWRQLQIDFLRFVNWTRPSGRRGNFYQLAQDQHPLLCALSTAESLSCPKSIGSIGGTTIFQGQQYSSCSKAGDCRAAQLLGGFPMNLPIVSWVTPTPGGTANFPGNWYSQPVILRPIGRSGQEPPVEYLETWNFINFSVPTAKKGYRQGPGSGILGESLLKATISQEQYRYQKHTKITYWKTIFLCAYPLLVLRPDLDSSQDSKKVGQRIFQKIQKLTKL